MTTEEFVDCSKQVLEKVFGVHVIDARIEREDGIFERSGERIISSLRFFGDYSGRVMVRLTEEDAERFIRLILKQYEIEIPIKESAVFAEMMNMYAANLTTELKRRGVNVSIHSPDLDFSQPILPLGSKSYRVSMNGEDGIHFSYLYLLDPGTSIT